MVALYINMQYLVYREVGTVLLGVIYLHHPPAAH